MRVLITGASGFVGAWTAKAVHRRGHHVRLLARSRAKVQGIASALDFDATDVVLGDMTDAATVAEALNGCDAVVHAAAVVALEAGAADHMVQANVRGAENVIGQAASLGLDPIVYVSSCTALWHRRCPLLRADLPVGGAGDDYAASKAEVERYVRELQRRGAPVIVTYPTAVIGPPAGDQYGESGEGIGSFVNSGVLGRNAGLTIVDVRDVAEAHAQLIEPGRGPRRYVVGGQHIPGNALAAELSRITGRTVRYIPVPDALLVAAGKLADRFRRYLPAELSKLSKAGARYLTDAPPADNIPAERDLGLSFRPASEALEALMTSRIR